MGIGLLFVTLACSEVIDLETSEVGGQIVIYGRITNGTQGNEVTVSRTADLGQAPEAVSNAVVKIIDETGLEESLVESTTEPGKYILERNILQGTVGTAYRLEAAVGGQTYRTGLQSMPEIIGEDELDWELVEETEISDQGVAFSQFVVKVYGTTRFDRLPDEFYVRWGIEESYTVLGMPLPMNRFPRYSPIQCYVTNDLSEQEALLLDGRRVRTNNLQRQLLATRLVDRSFGVKHYFNLIHTAVNRETHDYWSQINDIAAREGSIFDTPPAPVRGNIASDDPAEEVLGFFEVVAVDTARTFLTNNDIRVFFFDPCELVGEDRLPLFRVPRECVQCIIDEKIVDETCIFCDRIPNSSLTRPSYF